MISAFDGMPHRDRQVVCNGTPNPRYDGHTGVINRIVQDIDTKAMLADVIWDNPPPARLARQLIELVYLTDVDPFPIDYLIKEVL